MTLGQAIASCICALVYLTIESTRTSGVEGGKISSRPSFPQIVGWSEISGKKTQPVKEVKNGNAVNGNSTAKEKGNMSATVAVTKEEQQVPWSRSLLGLLLRTALCQTMASPFGFMSLRYISYPTMVLAKVSLACKLSRIIAGLR
jgi:solute carrier family 35 (UDP-galactose transporter), member B1